MIYAPVAENLFLVIGVGDYAVDLQRTDGAQDIVLAFAAKDSEENLSMDQQLAREPLLSARSREALVLAVLEEFSKSGRLGGVRSLEGDTGADRVVGPDPD